MNKTARLIITGKVQGVGFRAFVRNRSMKNNVTGWVKNQDDGSVEALSVSYTHLTLPTILLV